MQPNVNREIYSKWFQQVENTVPPSLSVIQQIGNGLLSAELFASTSRNTPGFREKKRQLLPAWPYSLRDEAQFRNQCNVSTTDQYKTGLKNLQTIRYWGPSDIVGLDANCSENLWPCDDPSAQALAQLHSNVSLSAGSLGPSIIEAGKTATMIADTAARINEARRCLTKGDLGGMGSALNISIGAHQSRAYRGLLPPSGPNRAAAMQKLASSAWLQYSYGWRPLISDVYTQAQNLANYLTDKSSVIRVARAKARKTKEHRVVTSSPGGGWRITANATVTKTVSYTARFSIPEGANSAANVFGLTNPALVVWEIVPYSFVVDWFLPIGQYFEQLTATQGLALWELSKSSQRTCQLVKVWSSTGKPEVDNATRTLTYQGQATAHGRARNKTREILSSWPSVPLPQFRNPASFAHLASTLALLRQTRG